MLEEYKNANTKILCKCKIDGNEWYSKPTNLIHLKRGCPECGKRIVSKKMSLSHNEFQFKLNEYNKNNNTYWKTYDTYKNNSSMMNFICEKDGYEVISTWTTLSSKGCKCINCENEKYHKKLVKHIEDNKMPIIVKGKYLNSSTPISCLCTICGENFTITPNSIISQNAIHRKCAYKIMGKQSIIPIDDFIKRLEESNPHIIYLDGYHGISYKAQVKCKLCEYIWDANIFGLLYGKGCPNCSRYKGETFISNFLSKHNITFNVQKTFNDLIGIGGYKLRYDFYLPKHNLLIEYQGIQHEKPVDFIGKGDKFAQDSFFYQQEHDSRKREYAKEHNIKLLEIWYWDFKNIEKILLKELDLVI